MIKRTIYLLAFASIRLSTLAGILPVDEPIPFFQLGDPRDDAKMTYLYANTIADFSPDLIHDWRIHGAGLQESRQDSLMLTAYQGDFVYWYDKPLPENFVLEFEGRRLSHYGAFAIYYSASLPSIDEKYKRVSLFNGKKGMSVLSDETGSSLKNRVDLAALGPDRTYRYRLIKWNGRMQLYLNGMLQMDYTTTQQEGNYVGLGLTEGSKMLLNQLTFYSLDQNPFDIPDQLRKVKVKNESELKDAVKQAIPGDIILLKKGYYTNLQIDVAVSGTASKRIVIQAERPGEVVFDGFPQITISGDYISLKDIIFKDGEAGIEIISDPSVWRELVLIKGNFNQLSGCLFDNFDRNPVFKNIRLLWVRLEGRSCRIDHNAFIGKRSKLNLLRTGGQVHAFNRIDHNYFNLFPGITHPIMIGSGWILNNESHTVVEFNLFERCVGEIISDKTSKNINRFNTFFNSAGAISLRQGFNTHVYANYFIEDKTGHEVWSQKRIDHSLSVGVNVRLSGLLIENNLFNTYFPAVILRSGAPEGFQEPGRHRNLPRHYAPASNTLIRQNTIISRNTAFVIEPAKEATDVKNRIQLASDITIRDNLIVNESITKLFDIDKKEQLAFQDNMLSNFMQIPAHINQTNRIDKYYDYLKEKKSYGAPSVVVVLAPQKKDVGPAWYSINQ